MVELWTSLPADPAVSGREAMFLRVLARLKPGVSVAAAQSEMTSVTESIHREDPSSEAFGARVVALAEDQTGDIRAPLAVFAAAVGLVLLTACVNLSGLILSRAIWRESEMAVRSALGATRWRLVRQFVTEAMVLSVLGGGVGVLLAHLGLRAMSRAIPERLLISDAITLDSDSVLFALVVSLLSGAVTGGIAAWPVSRPDLVRTLARQGRAGAGAGRRLGKWLVVVEVALAVVLATGAGLLVKSFWRLVAVERGFDPRDVVTARIWLPEERYPDPEAQRRFYRQLRERLRGLPGLEKLGAVQAVPLGGDLWQTCLSVDGKEFPEDAPPVCDFRVVWGDYFDAMGIRVLRGRVFGADDDAASSQVAVVNLALASRLWPGEEPLGKRLRAVGSEGPGDWATVVGVVQDVKAAGFRKKARAAVYRPLTQFPVPNMDLVARTSGDWAGVWTGLEAAVAELDRWVPAPRARPMRELVSASLSEERYGMLLLAGFAAMAMALGLLGAYGVTAFTVSRSRQEIGVRMALGAAPGEIVGLFLRRGAVWAGLGLVIGMALAFILANVMRSLLFGVAPRDPLIFGAVALLTACSAGLACYLPSRRAARLDPADALRSV